MKQANVCLKMTMAVPEEVSIAAARASVILEIVSIFHCQQSKKKRIFSMEK